MSAKLCRYPGECQGKQQGGCEFRVERIFTIPRPNGRSLGVHGFGTEQPEVLMSMDLELSNNECWCPWSWS